MCSTWELKDVKVTLPKEVKIYSEMVEKETGDCYIKDEKYVVSVKCALLFFYNPIHAVMKIAFKLFLQIPFDLFHPFALEAKNIGTDIKKKKILEAAMRVARCFKTAFINTIDNIYRIAVSPIYAVGFQLAVFWGIFMPYEGRKLAAKIESGWNGNLTRGHNYTKRIADGTSLSDGIYQILSNRENPIVMFEAFCFQPLGNIKDSRVVEVKE